MVEAVEVVLMLFSRFGGGLGTEVVVVLSITPSGSDDIDDEEGLQLLGEMMVLSTLLISCVKLVLVPFTLVDDVLLEGVLLLLLLVSRLFLLIATLARCFRLPTSFLMGFVNFTVECMFPS